MAKHKGGKNVAQQFAMVPAGGGQMQVVPVSSFKGAMQKAGQKAKVIVKRVAYERRHQLVAGGFAVACGLADRWKPELLDKIGSSKLGIHGTAAIAAAAEIPQHLKVSEDVKGYARDVQTGAACIALYLKARGGAKAEQPGEIPGVAGNGGGQDAGRRPESSAPSATGASPAGAPVEVEIIEGVA